MGIFEAIFYTVLLLVGFPFLVFITVKVGTYAYFAGRSQFIKEEERKHGDKKE